MPPNEQYPTQVLQPSEPQRTQEFFLTRALDPQGIITVLRDRAKLNTDKDHGETKFAHGLNKYFDIPDIGNKIAYGKGGSSIGIFSIFPSEAQLLGVTKFDQGSAYGTEVTIDNSHQITYDLYVFLEPHELPLIKSCKSKAEALQILKDDRETIRLHAIGQAEKLILVRTELDTLLRKVPRELIIRRIHDISLRQSKGESVSTSLEEHMSINGFHGMLDIKSTEAIVEELKSLTV